MPRARDALPSLFVLLLVATFVACDGGGGGADAGSDGGPDAFVPTGPIELALDLGVEAGFYDRPFPMEALRDAEGNPDLRNFPNPRRVDVVDAFRELVGAQVDGFSPTGPVYFRFTGPLDPSSAPADPAASLEAASSVFLVDLDPESPDRGQRTPVMVGVNEQDELYRPRDLLQVLPTPGFNLREDTLYAVVVTDGLRSASAERPLIQSALLGQLLAETAPGAEAGALAAEVYEDMAPLRTYLSEEGIAPSTIMAATVYRTGDVTSRLYGLAEWARAQPAPAPEGALTKIIEMPEYCAYQGTWRAPAYQSGEPPFSTEGGELVLDGDGHPIAQGEQVVPFVVTVPRRAMPAEGFPLLFYVNGTGGLTRQVIDRGVRPGPEEPPEPGTGPAQVAAMRGYAASGMAGHLTEERIGADASAGGYIFYNFFNPVAMRDNFPQSLIEHIFYRRLLTELRMEITDCPGVDASAAADGMVRYDPAHLAVMGQSLGSYLAGMLATIDPGYEGAILTGAGGSWIEFPRGARSPNLGLLARSVLAIPPEDNFDRFHPGGALLDLSIGASDNTHYLDDLLRRPRAGFVPPHVMVIEGDDDDNISTDLQRALVAAIGVDLVGEDVGLPEDRIEPWILLAGNAVVPAPLHLNRETPAGPRTAGVVRYAPDVDDGGHYVTFQLEGPKHQYGCFLQTLYETGTPTIPAPGAVTDPCE